MSVVLTIVAFMLALAIALTLMRLVTGPTRADRLVAAELMTGLVVALIAFAGWELYGLLALDVAIGLALVGFLGAVGLSLALAEDTIDEQTAGKD